LKYIIFLAVVITLNTLYWGWSEVYIHNGVFTEGLLKGVVASVVFVVAPFVVNFFVAIKLENK
jgi:hypothetical protein